MTSQELNRDIKKLYSVTKKAESLKTDAYFDFIENSVKPEFMRLYMADREAEYMNLLSIKIILKLNNRFRFIALHQLFINIKL